MTRESFPRDDDRLDYSEVEQALGPPEQYREVQTHARGKVDMFMNVVYVRRGHETKVVDVETIHNPELFGEWPDWARPNIAKPDKPDTRDNDLQPEDG